ncbi:N-acetyl-alpha-D-muramate 1-phosphate uridylyltransferase [Burkholderiales bacterium]|nr:MAG: nucleotidyltransferase family protein [Burkholderiales bacterium]CAG0986171.1 N-acetyl-alpha-D-muramate 1-phosphate uridylyltransferase [Burkholderiales bacterium]
MLLAAGRGERMRPLTDRCPKALLPLAGRPLIDRHLEKLAAAGVKEVVINVAHLGEQIIAHCGSGERWGLSIAYSREAAALETAGGIAYALPLLGQAALPIISTDIVSDYDYSALVERARGIDANAHGPRLHLVMVPNPDFHAGGDFAYREGRLALEGGERLTFGSLGVYDLALFRRLPRGSRMNLTPFYREWIARGLASAERFEGAWFNLGTPEQLAALELSQQPSTR